MRGDGAHRVSLDEVIATMRATGRDGIRCFRCSVTGRRRFPRAQFLRITPHISAMIRES